MDTTNHSKNSEPQSNLAAQPRPCYLRQTKDLIERLGVPESGDSDSATDISQWYSTLTSELEKLASKLDEAEAHEAKLAEKIGAEARNYIELENQFIEVHGDYGRLQTEVETLRRENLVLKEKGKRDPKTGAYNINFFDEFLSKSLTRWSNNYHCDEAHSVALLMVDIDSFTQFNTRYGHLTGDYVLKELFKLLEKPNVLPTGSRVCRYGGEEIGIVVPGCDRVKAETYARNVRDMIAEHHFHYDNEDLRVTVSTGVAVAQEGQTSKDLIEHADDALYLVKYTGKNDVHTWSPGYDEMYSEARIEYNKSKGGGA